MCEVKSVKCVLSLAEHSQDLSSCPHIFCSVQGFVPLVLSFGGPRFTCGAEATPPWAGSDRPDQPSQWASRATTTGLWMSEEGGLVMSLVASKEGPSWGMAASAGRPSEATM